MSFVVTQRVWKHSKLKSGDKLMLLALADLADDDGFCWPGYELLTDMTGVSERQAFRIVANLQTAGELIIWKQQGQGGGRGYTNIYLVTTGLTDQEIKEIVERRFELTGDEITPVLSQKGDIYYQLCHLKRITPDTLKRSRGVESDTHKEGAKGDTSGTHKGEVKSDTFDTHKGKRVTNVVKKGVRYVTRSSKEPKTTITPKGVGKKPPPPKSEKPKTGPKWTLMNKFIDESGIPMPYRKTDQRFWWSNISEIYKLVKCDVDTGIALIGQAIKHLRKDGLDIGGPESIVKTCRSLVGQRKNGAGSTLDELTPSERAAFEKLKGGD